MISTSWRPRTRRVLIAALILSVLIHFFGGVVAEYTRRALVAAHVLHERPKRAIIDDNQFVASSDVIHLERRTVPRRTQMNPHTARPQRASQPQPVVRPLTPTKPEPKILPQQQVARAETPGPVQTVPPELTRLAKAPRPKPERKKAGGQPDVTPEPDPQQTQVPKPQRDPKQLTPQQIAMLESQFAKTIQASRQDLPSAIDQTKEPVGGPKHYAMNFQGAQAKMKSEGDFYVLRAIRYRDGTVYYIHYILTYADGHVEEDDLPWPIMYPKTDDPIARHDKYFYIPDPPPDFRPTRPLKPYEQELYDYVHRTAGYP